MANSKELRRQLRECVGLVHLASREPDEDRADRLFLTSMRTLVEAGRPIQRRTTPELASGSTGRTIDSSYNVTEAEPDCEAAQ